MKPRTAKQQAAIVEFRQFGIALSRKPAQGSTVSWWIGLTRSELNARAKQEQDRMNASRFGQRMSGTTQE